MPFVEISDEDLKFIRDLALEIKTQNNCATAAPYYYVVKTRRYLPAPEGYGNADNVLVDMEGDPPRGYKTEAECRDALKLCGYTDKEIEDRVSNLEVFGQHEIEESRNVFFTKKGYEQHMELNGHNYRGDGLRGPHPYIEHATRNPEIDTLLKIVNRIGSQNLGWETPP